MKYLKKMQATLSMNTFFSVLGILFTSGVFSVFSISCSKVKVKLGSKVRSNSFPNFSSNVKAIQSPLPANFGGSYEIINDGLASIGLTSFDLLKSGFSIRKIYI